MYNRKLYLQYLFLNITILFYRKVEYEKVRRLLKKRFDTAVLILQKIN